MRAGDPYTTVGMRLLGATSPPTIFVSFFAQTQSNQIIFLPGTGRGGLLSSSLFSSPSARYLTSWCPCVGKECRIHRYLGNCGSHHDDECFCRPHLFYLFSGVRRNQYYRVGAALLSPSNTGRRQRCRNPEKAGEAGRHSQPSLSSGKPVYSLYFDQVWWGVAIGLVICLIIGGGMIGAFYGYGKDHFANTEDLWEGIFSLIASIIITIMGAALLRVNKLREKWRLKLAQALEEKTVPTGKWSDRFKHWAQKYFMFVLPFITVLREGLEAVVFIGGVSLSFPASAFPLPVITGILAGIAVGYGIYRGGNQTSLQIFLVISTCLLYLVAAGLCSRGVWYLENNTWNHLIGGDAAETGAGPGSYDIRQSVWHVNCCSPLVNGGGGWGIFNAILGWTNSATYGSVISYNLYWLVVIVWFVMMGFREQRGSWPLVDPLFRRSKRASQGQSEETISSGGVGVLMNSKPSADGATRLQTTEV